MSARSLSPHWKTAFVNPAGVVGEVSCYPGSVPTCRQVQATAALWLRSGNDCDSDYSDMMRTVQSLAFWREEEGSNVEVMWRHPKDVTWHRRNQHGPCAPSTRVVGGLCWSSRDAKTRCRWIRCAFREGLVICLQILGCTTWIHDKWSLSSGWAHNRLGNLMTFSVQDQDVLVFSTVDAGQADLLFMLWVHFQALLPLGWRLMMAYL